jgi:hypothetical protein
VSARSFRTASCAPAARHRGLLTRPSVIVAAAVTCALAVASAAAAAPPPTGRQRTAALAERVAGDETRALAKAQVNGTSVPVGSLTTPTSTTAANPQGTFTLTQTLQPTRVWQGGAWKPLDAGLHVNADHTLSPNATTNGLVLSGGGTGPLATMVASGHTLALSWPDALPAPTISGATATYPSVLDGVDLVVTASPQGGFSDTLVVKSRAAAANPKLDSLTMAAASNTLSVTADKDGDLSAAQTATGEPVFGARQPLMWDSAPAAISGSSTPSSSLTDPGEDAHVAPIATTATAVPGSPLRSSITLTPDQDLLTGSSTVYPVYIDPAWNPLTAGGSRQKWSSVSSALPSATEYDNSYDPNDSVLQVGFADGFRARSFIQFGISSKLANATIYNSDVKITVDNDGDEFCHSSTETDLYQTGSISKSISWNNQPSWTSKISSADATDCPNHSVDFDVTSFAKSHLAGGASSVTFGLRAPNESDNSYWEEFISKGGGATMSTEYDHAPALPSHLATSPGGPCQTGSPSATIIGNDDVTFEAVVSDPDGGQLGVQFVVTDYGTSTVEKDTGDSQTATTAFTATSGGIARLVLSRSTIQGWHADGATKAYQYSWYVRTSDGKLYSPTSGTGSSGSRCHFTYDPTQPAAPGVAVTTDTNGNAGALGQNAGFTLAPCADALSGSGTCPGTAPNRYTYQVNSSPPQSVLATGGAQTVQIPLTHVGPNTLTVFGISSGGNPGESASVDFTVTGPATPYPDGDIDGDTGHHPDLLAVGTTNNPGLWLAPSDGAANLDTPTDIGTAGTGINAAGSPADWSGAQILHGDFTGNHVQDVLAYYPTGNQAGSASLLNGNGDALPLNPYSGSQQSLPTGQFADYTLNPDGDNPTQLVPAGNASLTGSGIADLIGIAGDDTNGYQLDLYTACGQCDARTYTYTQTLAAPTDSPDGAGDWKNFSLVTAEPGGNAVLFAVKKTTGETWESTNPSLNPATPIGTPAAAGGTWTKLTVPWTSAPTFVSGDVNTAGKIELWAQASTNATPYTLSGTTVAQGTTVSLLVPTHEWPLTTSTGTTSSCTASVCTPDTRGGTDASAIGSVTFTSDPVHGAVAQLTDTGYLTLPQNLFHSSNILTLNLSFRADPGSTGILVSTGNDTPNKLNPGAMPVMYIGTDGRLYTQLWNGHVLPIISPQPVNDGQWHTVTFKSSVENFQDVYLDDNLRIGMANATDWPVNNADPLNFIGAGVFPANTSSKTWVNAPGDTTKTRASYFHGQIADVSYYNFKLLDAQLDPFWKPAPMVGPIVSGLSSAICVDDDHANTADKTKIQIWVCNNTAPQNWSLNPDGTITMTLGSITKCLEVTGSGTANSTLIELFTCNGSAGQQWHLDSSGQIWNPHADRCLADPKSSTTNGTQLIIYDCLLSKDQYWIDP